MASMFSLAAVKNSLDEVRAQVYPRNETERKVYEALSSKNWGASTSSLNELANDMFDYEKYKIITEIVWSNLNTEGKNWRQVFKTLTFIDFMIKNGSERFIEECRDRLHRIRALQDYNFYEENIDRGSGVREKSKQIVELLNNNEAIRSEREKARALRNKFVGIDSRNASSGGYGNSSSAYDNDRYSSGGRYDSYDSNPRRNNDSYAGNARRSSEISSGTTGRYGGGAYDSSRPSRYDDEPHFEEPKPTIAAAPKPASSSTGSTSTGGKLKVSIKKVASAAPKAAEVDLMPTGGDVDLIGGFDSAPAHSASAPTASSASDFDPFGITSSSSAPNAGPVADFDPFGVSQSFSSPTAPAAPAPVPAFDPFAAPAPVPAPAATHMAPANFAANFPVYSQPIAPVPLTAPVAPTPAPAPFGAFPNNNMSPMMAAPVFAPPAQGFAPQPSYQQAPAMNASFQQDNDFGDFEGAPQPAKSSAAAENKWGDLAKLVDLSKIEKNETAAAKQATAKPSSNFDSFAGLDGFSKAPSSMSTGSNRPIGSMMTASQPAMMNRPMGAPQGYPTNMNATPSYGMGAAPMAMPPMPMGAAPYGGAPYGAPMNAQGNASYPAANGMGMYNTGMAPGQGYMGAMSGGMMPPQNYGMPPQQQFRGGF